MAGPRCGAGNFVCASLLMLLVLEFVDKRLLTAIVRDVQINHRRAFHRQTRFHGRLSPERT